MDEISEHLYVLRDTCNVYLVRRGDAGLLIDAGGGRVGELLGDAGVSSLEWVLHTHHHRDQCWGTPGLVAEHGAKVAVPEYERYLFESAEEFWRTRRIFDNYNSRNTFFSPGRDIAVDAVLEDYEVFHWRGIDFHVLPAKGHTFGSSALIAEIDGSTVAFTGDLIAAGGHLHQLHALEYGYGDAAGVAFTLQSLNALRRRAPDRVLPSHGEPIDDARPRHRPPARAPDGRGAPGRRPGDGGRPAARTRDGRSCPSPASSRCPSTCSGAAPGPARTSTCC